MITKRTTRKAPQTVAKRPVSASRRISAGTSITSGVRNRNYRPMQSVQASRMAKLTPDQRKLASQLIRNAKGMSNVMAATNTANIAAKPEFIELLPLFAQQLLAPELLTTVAMTSREQIIPFYKMKAENTKGETKKGDIFSSPFANRLGKDGNFSGRVVKNEAVEGSTLAYVPVLPGSVTLVATTTAGVSTTYIDNGDGTFTLADGTASDVTINYATGLVEGISDDDTLASTYQYDNETVGPDADGQYGAKMGKIDYQLDTVILKAEAHQIASYYSVYAAFAMQQEYGQNMANVSKEGAIAELTAEINTQVFDAIGNAAQYQPQFNFDMSAYQSGAVMPTDFLNTFKFKLDQANASIYQRNNIQLRANKLTVGTGVLSVVRQLNGWKATAPTGDAGPYKAGTLDEYDVYVAPTYDPNKWVMSAKSDDIRKSVGVFGEYMPITVVDPLTLANMSVQTAIATMYDVQIVNPYLAVSGKVLGMF